MPHSLSVIYTTTSDNLRLQGMYYEPAKKSDTCVIAIHGMSGFFIENVWGDVLGQTLSNAGYAFIYAHNRGYAHINDISTSEIRSDNGFETRRNGAVYERFESCIFDIDAWVNHFQKLGYKKLIFLGHSLGGPKLIYWWKKRQPKNLSGLILASPADMPGLTKKGMAPDGYLALTQEAKIYIKKGQSSHLLSKLIDDWFFISAQTYVDEMIDGGPADVLPTLRNPSMFPELASITIPTLCFYGEFDSAVINSPQKDLALLKSKATACPDFQTAVIKGANHNYENREAEFSHTIFNWLKHL